MPGNGGTRNGDFRCLEIFVYCARVLVLVKVRGRTYLNWAYQTTVTPLPGRKRERQWATGTSISAYPYWADGSPTCIPPSYRVSVTLRGLGRSYGIPYSGKNRSDASEDFLEPVQIRLLRALLLVRLP